MSVNKLYSLSFFTNCFKRAVTGNSRHKQRNNAMILAKKNTVVNATIYKNFNFRLLPRLIDTSL